MSEQTSEPEAPGDIRISLQICNTYADGSTIFTQVREAVVPGPQSDSDDDALSDWADEHLRPFTGTGRTAGDAVYDVEVTACDLAWLVGQEFEFGY